MDHSYSVDRDVLPAAQRAASARVATQESSWSSAENQPHPASFADQINGLFGSEGGPDPLFFVESWTVGFDAATERFQTRHPMIQPQGATAPASRPFEFSMPPIIVDDESLFGPRSPAVPSGFSVAWKHAYGVDHPSASSHPTTAKTERTQQDQAPPSMAPLGLPLSAEDACRMLGVTLASTRKQIKTAYRQLAWRYHPDRLNGSSEHDRRLATDRMISLNEAYRLVSGAAAMAAN